jgi:DNA-binding NtrC family response regulator
VRVIAATNKDLEEEVKQGIFRQDLYYRINVFPIFLPPLRERRSDILLLADHFVAHYAKKLGKEVRRISTPAINMMFAYHWPGNVRELENIIERACALAAGPTLEASDIHLDAPRPASAAQASSGFLPEGKTLDQWEDDIIREAYRRANGNKSQAARLLGLSRNALRYRLEKIGIPDEPERL